MIEAATVGTVASGLILGWSVSWPPGPVNAEMIRRGLTSGFRGSAAVGYGACVADFLWALAVASGAGAVAGLPGVRPVLATTSLLLLLFLSWSFFRGALLAYRRHRRPEEAAAPPKERFSGARGGFLLGLTMALSSPWNLAFWLAVMGGQSGTQPPFATSLLLAASVVFAAAVWTTFLCAAVHFGARFATPAWEITTQALTGLLMAGFAVRLVWRLTYG